jgi:hypothetical protein
LKELDETLEQFKDIDRLIIKGASDMRALQSQISATNSILESKGWEIFSRFISGTGLWRIQNRVKASIQLVNTMMSAEDRRRVKQAKEIKTLAEISRTSESIHSLSTDINKALEGTGKHRNAAIKRIKEESEKMSESVDYQINKTKELEKLAKKRARASQLSLLSEDSFLKTLSKRIAKRKEESSISKGIHKMKQVTGAMGRMEGSSIDKTMENLGSMTTFTKGRGKLTRYRGGEGNKEMSKMAFNIMNSNIVQKRVAKFAALKKKADETGAVRDKLRLAIERDIRKVQIRMGKAIYSIATKVAVMFMFVAKMVAFLLLLVLGLTLLKKVFEDFSKNFIDAFNTLKDTFVTGLQLIFSGLGNITEGFAMIFNASTLTEVFTGVGKIIVGGLEIVLGVAVATVGAVLAAGFEFIRSVFSDAFANTSSLLGGIVSGILNVVEVVAGVVAAIALVAAIFIGMPALIVAGFALVIYGAIKFFKDPIIQAFDYVGGLIESGIGIIKSGIDKFVGFLKSVFDILVGAYDFLSTIDVKIASAIKEALSGPVDKIKDAGGSIKSGAKSFIGRITNRAVGGPASGLTLVGEQGPELVTLPSGSRVHTNRQSAAMMGGVTNNITVQVTGRVGANDAEIRDIANKVAREINSRMNRTTTSVVKF